MQGWRGSGGAGAPLLPAAPPRSTPPPQAARARAADRGWAPPLLVALAYRAQLVGEVPVEPHDARVDAIVTADEAIVCTPAGAAALALA